jgi:hypothetical protein
VPVLGDPSRQFLVEVGVSPDVVDDEDRTTPKSSRRESQELSQIRTITDPQHPFFFSDGRRRRGTDILARRGTHGLSLGSQLPDEGGDAIHRGIDHGQ